MKNVVLAAGFGSRSKPLSSHVHKSLFPIGEKRAINYQIELAQQLGLEPIVVVGYRAKEVKEYVIANYEDIPIIENKNPTPNLLESLHLCEEEVDSTFVWSGAAMFFDQINTLKQLIEYHKPDTLMSLLIQNKVDYKPKIIVKDNVISEFFVGEGKQHGYSAPTFFVCSPEIFSYLGSGETTAIQHAINDGKTFNFLHYSGWSRELHNLQDYLTIQKQFLGNSYTNTLSNVSQSNTKNSFVYDSNIENSEIINSIIINSQIKNKKIKERLVINEKEYSLSVCD